MSMDFNDIHRRHGSNGARAAFDQGVTAEAKKKRLVRSLSEFLADFEPPDYVLDGILQRRFLYSLTGATGAGKTAIATLLAALVGHPKSGQKFGPHTVEKGRVVYIAAENKTDVQMRFIAQCVKLGVKADELDILVIDKITDLAKQYPTIEAEIQASGPVDLVIVDTAPALFPGDDENSNVQSGQFTRNIRELTELPGGPCALALYHPIKRPNSADDLLPRGGGATIAEVDGNLSLWAMNERVSELHWRGKFRGPGFEPILFKMEKPFYAMALVDKKGRAIPTVVAVHATDADAEENEAKEVFQERRLLAAMVKSPEASISDWARECHWLTGKGDEQQPYKSLVQRVLKRLIAAKLVNKTGRIHAVTKAGKEIAAAH